MGPVVIARSEPAAKKMLQKNDTNPQKTLEEGHLDDDNNNYLPKMTTTPEDQEVQTGNECCAGVRATIKRYQDGVMEFGSELKELAEDIDVTSRAKKACSLNTLKGKLPIIQWLPKYRLKHFTGDLIAGLTVGLTVIPQGLAYSLVAGLSPEYGLYSAFMGCFIYLFLGTSKDITLGPTAIMSLLTGEFGKSPVEQDATYAIILSLICGIIQLLMGILHIGFIVDYISHPVINSFTSAAAITIAWSQVKKWLGLKKIPRDFIYEVYWTFRKLPETKLWDFLLGLCCLIALYGLKKTRDIKWGDVKAMSKILRVIKYVVWLTSTARNAVVVVIASGVSAGFIAHNLKPFSLTGHIKAGLPPFKAPSFTVAYNETVLSSSEVLENIGAGFAILSLLGLVETIAIGKAFARKNGYDIDADQELLAIGASNILGSFVGAYPVTGSFSRTAVNSHSGVMTPAGGIWTAVLVLLALSFLTPLFYYIPDAALAAVIIMAVIDMVDFSLLPKLWRIKKLDLLPWIVTFICCLVIGIEWGIVIGVALSLLILLFPWARPTIKKSFDRNIKYEIIDVGQGLMFPGVEYFSGKVESWALSGKNPKSAIIDMHCVSNVDYTSVENVEQLFEDFARKKKKLILCNLRSSVLNVFLKAKLKHFAHAASLEEAINLLDVSNKNSLPSDKTFTSEQSDASSETSIRTTSIPDDENLSSEASITPAMEKYSLPPGYEENSVDDDVKSVDVNL